MNHQTKIIARGDEISLANGLYCLDHVVFLVSTTAQHQILTTTSVYHVPPLMVAESDFDFERTKPSQPQFVWLAQSQQAWSWDPQAQTWSLCDPCPRVTAIATVSDHTLMQWVENSPEHQAVVESHAQALNSQP